jgi:GNAT superfamily N-acetyltransferase
MTAETSDPFKIRPAAPGDCIAIAGLASELHATLGDPVGNFTPDVIRTDGFGAEPQFRIIVAETSEGLAGYALYGRAYETAYAARGLYLNDLFVRPVARRRGIAAALVQAVKDQARRESLQFVWWVSDPKNVPAQEFYAAMSPQNEKIVRAHAIVLDR